MPAAASRVARGSGRPARRKAPRSVLALNPGRCSRRPAPRRAQVKEFAKKAMKTSEVRVDVKLNKFLWSKGIRNVRARDAALDCLPRPPGSAAEPRAHAPPQVPRRVRIQISRRRNDDEDAKARLPPGSVRRRASRVGNAAHGALVPPRRRAPWTRAQSGAVSDSSRLRVLRSRLPPFSASGAPC